jgi:hypothetical protein
MRYIVPYGSSALAGGRERKLEIGRGLELEGADRRARSRILAFSKNTVPTADGQPVVVQYESSTCTVHAKREVGRARCGAHVKISHPKRHTLL